VKLNSFHFCLSSTKTKKSFVIVVPNVDYNAIPDQLTVVPSLLEAHDISKEIERIWAFLIYA
jgi:hypothetical protein